MKRKASKRKKRTRRKEETEGKTRSAAEFYGLTEIPFEPTGAAAGKYPYVAPDDFVLIEEKISEVVAEKKLYVILLKAPQGGGKTATAGELEARLKSGKYVKGPKALVLNKLMNLDIRNYAKDFVKKTGNLVPETMKKKCRIDEKTSPSEMKDILVEILRYLGRKNELTFWIIDEFDILVDYPRPEQSRFLQFIREIIDELASERFPVLFLMSHTMKSSKEFEKYLKGVHGPFESRIVAPLEIGYHYDEVRRIVAARLYSVSKKRRQKDSIEPFSENALKSLCGFIVDIGGTGELSDFRFFERCCYFAILRGAKKQQKKLDLKHVRKIFEELYASEPVRKPEIELSIGTRSKMISLLRGNPMVRNEAVLRGLLEGLKLLKDDFLTIANTKTERCVIIQPDINISSLEFTTNYRGEKNVNTLWFIAAKDKGMIVKGDAKGINDAIGKIVEARDRYTNLTILSYVSNLDLDESQTSNCDEVLRISLDTMRDLIGLGVALPEDVDSLRKSFDADIATALRGIYSKRVRDITGYPTAPSVYTLLKTLNMSYFSGKRLTKEALRDQEKELYGKSTKTRERYVSDIIELGFAAEEGTQIVPRAPRSLVRLMEILKQGVTDVTEIYERFGDSGEAVVTVAEQLGMIKLENMSVKRVYPYDLEKKVRKDLKTSKSLSEDKTLSNTFAAKRAKTIIKAIEEAESKGNEFAQLLIYGAAIGLLPGLNESLIQKKKEITAAPQPVEPLPAEEKKIPKVLPEEIGKAAAPEKPTMTFDEAINSCLKDGKSITLSDLVEGLEKLGYVEDVRTKIIGLIIQDKLKISL